MLAPLEHCGAAGDLADWRTGDGGHLISDAGRRVRSIACVNWEERNWPKVCTGAPLDASASVR